MDYLTKWPEAFTISDQKAETIAKLFVENIVCCHGIPEDLLSDRGTNFLSSLIKETCQLLGVKKINTSGYHPQTDGLVEKLNSTLISMIAKSCDVRDRIYSLRTGCQHRNLHESLHSSFSMVEMPGYPLRQYCLMFAALML